MAKVPRKKRISGRAAAGPVFTGEKGDDESAKDKTDDLGADVLDDCGPVKAECPRDVPLKTCDTDSHVRGVTEVLQKRSHDTDDGADDDDTCSRCAKITHVNNSRMRTAVG